MNVAISQFLERWRSARQQFADLFFPPECAICHGDLTGHASVAICHTCQQSLLATLHARRCARCGAQTPVEPDDRGRCYACRTEAFQFTGVIPLGDYKDSLKRTVLMMKKWQRDPLSLAVGRLTADVLAERLQSLAIDLVVPIPMHWTRRWWRATNSPDLLAEEIAGRLGVRDHARCLVRTRHTEQQSLLPPSRRAINVRHVFRVRGSPDLSGQTILLVDDILTTGATCNDAARALIEAGAGAVYVCVVARAAG